MIPIKRTIEYECRDRGSMRLRVIWGKNRLSLSCGYFVDKQKWDPVRCRPRMNTTHGKGSVPAFVISRALEQLVNKINETFYSFEMDEKLPSALEFKRKFNGKCTGDLPDVEKAWMQFKREGESLRQWSFNTVKCVNQVQNLVKKLYPDLEFPDIDVALLNEFVIKQQKSRLSKGTFVHGKSGYANNVIRKNCSVFKNFLRWCVTKGYIGGDIVEGWRPAVKIITRPVVFLDWDELMSVFNLDLHDNSLWEEIRDIFCLQCFTSLRYSDVMALSKSNVHEDYILVTTVKTSSNLRIDLNKYSRAILEKYSAIKGDKAMPYHDNSSMNSILKKIGKLAGVNEPLTISQYFGSERVDRTVPKYELMSTHCGRRTFVCNALSMGIAPHIVMKWTGHKDYSAMKPYIDVADKVRKGEMSKFDQR